MCAPTLATRIANNGFLAIGAKARLSQNPDVGGKTDG